MTMATILRRAIRESGLTQREIARRSGVCKQTITLFVRHRKDMLLSNATRVGKVVGVEMLPMPKGRRVGAGRASVTSSYGQGDGK